MFLYHCLQKDFAWETSVRQGEFIRNDFTWYGTLAAIASDLVEIVCKVEIITFFKLTLVRSGQDHCGIYNLATK